MIRYEGQKSDNRIQPTRLMESDSTFIVLTPRTKQPWKLLSQPDLFTRVLKLIKGPLTGQTSILSSAIGQQFGKSIWTAEKYQINEQFILVWITQLVSAPVHSAGHSIRSEFRKKILLMLLFSFCFLFFFARGAITHPIRKQVISSKRKSQWSSDLTNFMAYRTHKYNLASTRALQ